MCSIAEKILMRLEVESSHKLPDGKPNHIVKVPAPLQFCMDETKTLAKSNNLISAGNMRV